MMKNRSSTYYRLFQNTVANFQTVLKSYFQSSNLGGVCLVPLKIMQNFYKTIHFLPGSFKRDYLILTFWLRIQNISNFDVFRLFVECSKIVLKKTLIVCFIQWSYGNLFFTITIDFSMSRALTPLLAQHMQFRILTLTHIFPKLQQPPRFIQSHSNFRTILHLWTRTEQRVVPNKFGEKNFSPQIWTTLIYI